MTDAQRIPQVKTWKRIASRIHVVAVYTMIPAACVPLQQPTEDDVELLVVPGAIAVAAGLSPVAALAGASRMVPLTPNTSTASSLMRLDVSRTGRWIIDRVDLPADSFPFSERAALVTFGGSTREPATLLRLLQADTAGRRRAAAALRTIIAAESLHMVAFLPGSIPPRDRGAMLVGLTDLSRSARLARAAEVAIAIAGADTAGYPSRELAGISDALLLNVGPRAPLASPGPPVTIEDIRRSVGLRSSEVGRGRLIILLPVHGYVWHRDSLPRPIGFQDGVRLANEWRADLRRDDASQALFARAPGRGELWLLDARLAAVLVRESRAMGIRKFAVVLGAGEDVALADSLSSALQTISRSR
ncbi:MAG TPA: hypothetical protein VMM17_11255 [Gemmatimonadaceae bacterium]|nr:hypothetical protein [Gemmatimonadaceae bacterium]